MFGVLFLVFVIFFVIGVIFISGIMDGTGRATGKLIEVTKSSELAPERIIGIFFAAFSGVILLFISWKMFSKNPSYLINEESLTIKPFGIFPKNITYTFAEIQSVEKISAADVETLTTRLLRDAEWEKWTFQLPSMFRDQLKFLKLIQYCSVPITVERVSIGEKGIPVYIKTQTDGEFIFLSLRSGERLLLTPKDIDGFLNLLRGKLSSFGYVV